MYRQIICGTIANIIPPLFYFLITNVKKKKNIKQQKA